MAEPRPKSRWRSHWPATEVDGGNWAGVAGIAGGAVRRPWSLVAMIFSSPGISM